jgi:hypothetical protein
MLAMVGAVQCVSGLISSRIGDFQGLSDYRSHETRTRVSGGETGEGPYSSQRKRWKGQLIGLVLTKTRPFIKHIS